MAVAVRSTPSFLPLRERGRAWWALGGCLLLALVLRAPYLSTGLGLDEGGVAFIAKNWPSGDGSLYGSYWLDRPPLLVALYRVAVLGGDTGVRVLGALAALALVTVVTMLAREVAGQRAGLIAGLLAALLTGSVVISAVYTPGELLAAVPSALSVLCLVLAHRRRRARWVFAAGLLAAAALLIKQSFLDAGLAGLAFVVASGVVDRDVRVRWPLVYATGAAMPMVARTRTCCRAPRKRRERVGGVGSWVLRSAGAPRRAGPTAAAAGLRWRPVSVLSSSCVSSAGTARRRRPEAVLRRRLRARRGRR